MNTPDGATSRDAEAAEFPHPYLAVDVVILTVVDRALQVLLVRPDSSLGNGAWALPGKFVQMRESLPAAVAGVLGRKAGLQDVFTEQLYTFGDDVLRDPRHHVMTVVYYALVDRSRLTNSTSTDEPDRCLARILVPWQGDRGDPWTVIATESSGEQLRFAYDHQRILGATINRLRGKLNYSPIGYQLLPPHFTLRELRAVHEALLGESLNPDSFRRRMLSSSELEPTGKTEGGAGHRPAELFRCVAPARSPQIGQPRRSSPPSEFLPGPHSTLGTSASLRRDGDLT